MYQTDPDALPDGHFAPGELRWLVPGNWGRLLDARRTPVRVTGVDVAHGYFEAEILAFEDAGARWLVPLEEVTSYQFAPDGAQAPAGAVADMQAAIGRLNVTVDIPADQTARRRSQARIAAERARAGAWLTAHGAPARIDPGTFIASRRGSAEAAGWLAGYLAEAGLDGLPGMDHELAASYVSNPWSGDLVRAHLITIARLGVAAYQGKAIRDPASLAGRWAEHRRAEHIIHRAAFTQALWQRASRPGLMIYRGIGLPGEAAPAIRATGLVSASFSRAVAESHFDAPLTGTAALLRTRLPTDRLFMSFLETKAMNKQYLEADAVLFTSGGLL